MKPSKIPDNLSDNPLRNPQVNQHDYNDDSDAADDYYDDEIYHLYTRFPKVDTESVGIPVVEDRLWL